VKGVARQTHIAGLHLQDEERDEFNAPFSVALLPIASGGPAAGAGSGGSDGETGPKQSPKQ
jgi:hypothetical protein